MSSISLQMPNSLFECVSQLAKQDDTSINEFINLTLNEKVMQQNQKSLLKSRAKRGNEQKFLNAMAKVADVPAVKGDEL